MNKKISNAQFIEEIKEFASKQNVQSLDELNAKVAEFVRSKNELPIHHFLGVSPHQMHLILNRPFALTNDLFQFTFSDMSRIKEIAIIKQARFFMEKLQEMGELKGTQLGNLPKNFVVEFYQLFLSNERYARMPNREDDVYQLSRLKHLLDMAGLIKKKNKKFSLTKKGQLILLQENYLDLYREIILSWANHFSWGFSDGYSDLALIQRSAVFNFYLLYKIANDWIEDEELSKHYLNAFPDLVLEVRDFFSTPEREIIQCFSVRFLERFCLPIGLVEKREEGSSYSDRKIFFKVTPFFIESFKFVAPS
jgi:hypothetical protein